MCLLAVYQSEWILISWVYVTKKAQKSRNFRDLDGGQEDLGSGMIANTNYNGFNNLFKTCYKCLHKDYGQISPDI